jgi:hypothetical protein
MLWISSYPFNFIFNYFSLVVHTWLMTRSRVSSVSIVSDYGLDDRVIGVRSPAMTKGFSSNLCVQTGSEAHPASCTMGTGGRFPGAKRDWGVTLIAHPHQVPRSGMSRSYTSSPQPPPWRVAGLLNFYFMTVTTSTVLRSDLRNVLYASICWRLVVLRAAWCIRTTHSAQCVCCFHCRKATPHPSRDGAVRFLE